MMSGGRNPGKQKVLYNSEFINLMGFWHERDGRRLKGPGEFNDLIAQEGADVAATLKFAVDGV